MKTLSVITIMVAIYVLSYLSFYNDWDWFWKPIELITRIPDSIGTFRFIKLFPMLIGKYHLNPFRVSVSTLRQTLSEEDKIKFINGIPEAYKETAKEFFF